MKQIIIVPYRDREDHLRQFVQKMEFYLPGADILIVEQTPKKEFNRGKLLNIGALHSINATHYVFHDVDMLPEHVDYSPNDGVTQLAASKIQLHGYLGGVTMFEKGTFNKAGGYHNEYYHRAEDNEMRANLQRLKIPVLELPGSYKVLPHKKILLTLLPRYGIRVRSQELIKIC